jgi:hypothetical protein
VWTDTRAEFGPRPTQLEEDKVSALIRTTPKKSGADVYGWTYEHLQTLIGDKDAIKTLTGTLNHILGSRITSETAKDLNTVRVTPLLKGTRGNIRPITVGTTLKRFALSTMIKCEKHLRELVGESEFAIGRKSAIEDMKRSIDAAIDKVTQNYGKAVVFQLDCSCAFNRAPRQTCLTKLEERPPTSWSQWDNG